MAFDTLNPCVVTVAASMNYPDPTSRSIGTMVVWGGLPSISRMSNPLIGLHRTTEFTCVSSLSWARTVSPDRATTKSVAQDAAIRAAAGALVPTHPHRWSTTWPPMVFFHHQEDSGPQSVATPLGAAMFSSVLRASDHV
eukprot:PhF_6_TR40638/c0_g1_i1/m.61007